MEGTITLILGGGKGSRLFPLTKDRAKPAVPLAGKYRLIDIPLSNCINSGLRKIYILTQYQSASLNHHVTSAYSFDSFTQGIVDILPAQQYLEKVSWYEGTADAVRKNFIHFRVFDYNKYLILSGDHLYRMDYRDFIKEHMAKHADISIGIIPVTREDAANYGILKVNNNNLIKYFKEKPKTEQELKPLFISESRMRELGSADNEKNYLASMGLYIFQRNVLEDLLNNDLNDFAKDILPFAINKGYKVYGYPFNGYWRDIGTIKNFFEANLELTDSIPEFNLYDEKNPIYTNKRFLPPCKDNSCNLKYSIIADGCIIEQATIENSIIGIRSIINAGAYLNRSILMGADFYETSNDKHENMKKIIPNIGIGKNSRIQNTIIDKNVRIGNNVSIGFNGPYGKNTDDVTYYIRNGIIIIPKMTIVPSGTTI